MLHKDKGYRNAWFTQLIVGLIPVGIAVFMWFITTGQSVVALETSLSALQGDVKTLSQDLKEAGLTGLVRDNEWFRDHIRDLDLHHHRRGK